MGQEGDLTAREKSLIALAVAHTIPCPYCIDTYTKGCLEKGSNLSEMTEALHVATAIRGGLPGPRGSDEKYCRKNVNVRQEN